MFLHLRQLQNHCLPIFSWVISGFMKTNGFPAILLLRGFMKWPNYNHRLTNRIVRRPLKTFNLIAVVRVAWVFHSLYRQYLRCVCVLHVSVEAINICSYCLFQMIRVLCCSWIPSLTKWCLMCGLTVCIFICMLLFMFSKLIEEREMRIGCVKI